MKTLESELYTGRFDDGLLDLLVGMGLLGIGVVWLSDRAAFTGVVPAVLIPLWMILRKRITEPRLGRVEFQAARQRTERAWLGSMLAIGVAILGLMLAAFAWVRLGTPAGDWTALVPLLPAVLIGLGLVLVSAMIGARRFAAYALALIVLAAVTSWLGLEPGVYLAVSGGLLCVWAGAVVARFMASHPALDHE